MQTDVSQNLAKATDCCITVIPTKKTTEGDHRLNVKD